MEDGRFSKIAKDYELFRLVCPHYDKFQGLVGKLIADNFNYSRQELIDVLEIGHGTGNTTTSILKADPRIIVTAIDNEENMIAQAKENLKYYIEIGRVNLVKSDALDYIINLRREQKQVDALCSAFVLHNFEASYRNEFIYNMTFLIKENGVFVNADKYFQDRVVKHHEAYEWQINMFFEEFGKRGMYNQLEYWIKHYHEDEHPKKRMSLGYQKTLLEIREFKVQIVQREHMDAVLVARK